MLDKRNQPYVDYLERLEREKFTGKIDLRFNWFKGVIANMNRKSEPLPGVTQEESVVLK